VPGSPPDVTTDETADSIPDAAADAPTDGESMDEITIAEAMEGDRGGEAGRDAEDGGDAGRDGEERDGASPTDGGPCSGLDGPVAGVHDTYTAYAETPGTSRHREYPPFPTAGDVFAYYNERRASYYHDGMHVFEPRTLTWDDDLSAIAQRYAEELASACAAPAPTGERIQDRGKDPFWVGRRAGVLVAAGVEHVESWRNFLAISGEEFCWYSSSTSSWRAGYLRFDECEGCGYTRLGVGIADVDPNQRWVVFAWGSETTP